MRVCGCEISASEVRLAVVHRTVEGNIEMRRLNTTRFELEDDTSEADLRSFLAAIQEFSRENEIDTFVVKTRAKKGRPVLYRCRPPQPAFSSLRSSLS